MPREMLPTPHEHLRTFWGQAQADNICGEPGLSVWTDEGSLSYTMCLKTKGHAGPHEPRRPFADE